MKAGGNVNDWLEYAAAQIDATIALDQEAGSKLATAVCDMLEMTHVAAAAGAREQQLAISVAMQQHDRLMQQLNHVAAGLRALAGLLAVAPAAQDWQALRARHLTRLSMQEERNLFARLMPIAGSTETAPADAPLIGSIELF
jgi:hypothetical protein